MQTLARILHCHVVVKATRNPILDVALMHPPVYKAIRCGEYLSPKDSLHNCINLPATQGEGFKNYMHTRGSQQKPMEHNAWNL